jgi:sec-independent protein translocase protein TatC
MVALDRMARAKDDLFDNSTMTFGEHLEELRSSLVKALLWLGAGMVIGLGFCANGVIQYIQEPLKVAIQEFNADRDLTRFGFDPHAPESQPIRNFLKESGLVWEVVYDIPDEFQSQSLKLAEAASTGQDSTKLPEAEIADLGKLVTQLPDPTKLVPRVQLRRSEVGLSSLKIEEPFMIWFKAGLVVGTVLASPMIFYHLWTFIAAGLHSHERKYVYIYLPVSVTLFVSGVVLAFYFVMQYVLSFLLTFNDSMDVAVEPRLTYYVNFVLLMPLGFGIAFQLPLVMLFLQRIGIIETQAYIDSWRIAILAISVISMLLTPADVTSMMAMAIPLCVLYFLGIAMCKFIPRGRGLGSGAYDPA